MAARRFPPPWVIDEHNDACFIVKDHKGQPLAYVYFEEEPGAARPIAAKIANCRSRCRVKSMAHSTN